LTKWLKYDNYLLVSPAIRSVILPEFVGKGFFWRVNPFLHTYT